MSISARIAGTDIFPLLKGMIAGGAAVWLLLTFFGKELPPFVPTSHVPAPAWDREPESAPAPVPPPKSTAPQSEPAPSVRGSKIIERQPDDVGGTKALPKGDMLIHRKPGVTTRTPERSPGRSGGAGNASALAHIKINGSDEFVQTMQQTLADFAERASPEMIENISHVRLINELQQDGGRILAYIRDGDCVVRIYPRGWQASASARAAVLAHEAWHCSLNLQGRFAESRNHGPSFARIEQQAAMELYGGGGIPGRVAGAGSFSGGYWRRPCNPQEEN